MRQTANSALRPLGGKTAGHKGYGLAVVVELFAALVGDAGVAGGDDRAGGNAGAFVVVDPSTFTDAGDREERLASLAAHLRDVEPLPGESPGIAAADEVGLLPGEPEHRTADDLGVTDSLPAGVRERTE